MTARREFSAKIKVAAFERSGGNCEQCTARLYAGKYHYDHDNPDGLTGEPTLANCRVLCVACHSVKTRTQDMPAIARAKRRQRKHAGIRKPSRFPGSRASKWRKRMDGTVERRNP